MRKIKHKKGLIKSKNVYIINKKKEKKEYKKYNKICQNEKLGERKPSIVSSNDI